MSSPYLLPEGNVQIAFSGGRTSAYMLHHIAEANGGLPEGRVQAVFANTGREMPETLDFVQECERRWGLCITRVERRPNSEAGFEVVGHQGLSVNGEPLRDIILARGFLPNATIIEGGASGADTLAREWADANGFRSRVYRARWQEHGKAAGPIRNQMMLDVERPILVIAFPGSRGTADMMRRAKAAGVPVIEVKA